MLYIYDNSPLPIKTFYLDYISQLSICIYV